MYLLLVCAICWNLTETAAYTALDEHDHINVGEQLESYTRMFQYGIRRETWQCIIMRRIETIATQILRKFSKISANNKASVFKYRSLYSPSLDGESLPDIHGVSIIVLGYYIACQRTEK